MLNRLLKAIHEEQIFNNAEIIEHFKAIIDSIIELDLPGIQNNKISSLLIEVAYQLLSRQNKDILLLRKEKWSDSFGVPPLYYRLKNQMLINKIESAIKAIESIEVVKNLLLTETNTDDTADVTLYDQYDKPQPDKSGAFIPTVNKQGYMTSTPADPFSKLFIENAESSGRGNGKVLEIGAAFGVATLAALEKGATVVCNDMAPEHLAVVVKEHAKMKRGSLIPVVGEFPEELVFEDNEFDAILISRVLHFFDGERLIAALDKARSWLKPGGNLYVVNETPYLANWKMFLEEYEQRKERGDKWPGLITNTKLYETNRSFSLPPLVHWLDEDTLRQALSDAGFEEQEISISYINREGQFPSDMLMKEEQRESVGCKATK